MIFGKGDGIAVFGYITPNLSALDEAQRARYRAVYCGLCHVLLKRHGLTGTMTLSNDLTFLALLLNSLYEFDECVGEERCVAHPIKRHSYVFSEAFEYAADMNVVLAYHKCMDNWRDERNILSRSEAMLLKNAYRRVSKCYPDKCAAVEAWIQDIHHIEENNLANIDAPVNSTGQLLGKLFGWKDDFWTESLRIIGDGLGRFIYMMDAYEDLPKDMKSGSFNPLKFYHANDDFEAMCKDALLMMVADCTQEFEQLPIMRDVYLLRNILYSGIWNKYTLLQKKKKEDESKGA